MSCCSNHAHNNVLTHDHMTIAMRDKFIAIISLVALRGQIMTVKVHPGLFMKYSRWVILMFLACCYVVAKVYKVLYM